MITTQKQVREAFWDAYRRGEFQGLNVTPRRFALYSGEKTHNTDTRSAFVDFIDSLSKSGQLKEGLVERVTL